MGQPPLLPSPFSVTASGDASPRLSRSGPFAQHIPEKKPRWLVKGRDGRLELRLFITHTPASSYCCLHVQQVLSHHKPEQSQGWKTACIPQSRVGLGNIRGQHPAGLCQGRPRNLHTLHPPPSSPPGTPRVQNLKQSDICSQARALGLHCRMCSANPEQRDSPRLEGFAI